MAAIAALPVASAVAVAESTPSLETTDKWALAESLQKQLAGLLKELKKEGKGKRRARKERDPDAPKKEPNDWIKLTQAVREALKAEYAEDAEEMKVAKAVVTVTQVARMLKESGSEATREAVIET